MIGERPIADLATALAKAQAEIKHAEKSAENPAFKREGKVLKYATLADVWDACRGPLTKHGLAVVQEPARTDYGISVTTTLLHTSGQWLSSTLEVPVGGGTAQALGSALTYARRYALASIVGIAPDEDDDGNAASVQAPRNYEPRRQQQRPREPIAPHEAEPIDAKPDPHVNNLDELRTNCERLSKRLKGYMHINVGEMRREARVPTSGSLSAEQLVLFLRWCQTQMRSYEDPSPDDIDGDAPAWMLSPDEQAP